MIILTLVVELFAIIIAFVSFKTFSILEQNDNAQKLSISVMKINSINNDFKNKRDSNFKEIYYSNINEIEQLFKDINSYIDLLPKIKTDTLSKFIKDYRKYIEEYIKLIEIIGLSENEGLEGDFRFHVHQAASEFYNLNIPIFNIELLQARRAEKDYIVRGRKEYFTKTMKNINEMSEKVRKTIFKKVKRRNFYQVLRIIKVLLLLTQGFMKI